MNSLFGAPWESNDDQGARPGALRPLAASTRYRLGQYVPGLAEQGIDLQICYLLGDDYLRRRFGGGALPIAAMMHAALNRIAILDASLSMILQYFIASCFR
jgi:hypothetical protein